MARTVLTAQQAGPAGLAPTTVTPDASGVQFANNSNALLMVTNGSGASINVTPKIGRQVLGKSVTSDPVAVAAGATKFFGPFDSDWEQPGGKATVFVDFSAVTSVTVALIQA